MTYAAQQHYLSDPDYYKSRSKARKADIRRQVDAIKSVPCADCKVEYPPYVMAFDHLGDKEFNIARMVSNGMSMVRILEEIAKCEVVCSNCHAARTFRRSTADSAGLS